MNPGFDLLSDDEDVLEAAFAAAVKAGAPGERGLLDTLRFAQDEHHAAGIVSALGEVDGPDGVAVLREIIAQPEDPREVRTTALVALTKRQGVAASDVLLTCLSDWDQFMPGYALMGLRGAEQRWLTATWAACNPSHPESVTKLDPTWFADWISAPLFEALYLNDASGGP